MLRIWRAGLAVTLVFSVFSAACSSDDKAKGDSPQKACEDAAVTVCKRLFECFDAATLAVLGYTTESGCVSQTKMEEGCDSKTLDNACEGSLKYHGDQAAKCVTQFNAATCAQIMGGDADTFAPACDLVCTAD